MPFAFLGFSLGLSAGLAPGPLLALVIQRSLQGGMASGLRVALAPLITDLPIIIISLLVVGRLPEVGLDMLLAVGGLVVLWLGVDAWRSAGEGIDTSVVTTAKQDVVHGALINLLNPHPYLFWATLGAPTVIRAWRLNPAYAVAFMVLFYALLIGSKVALAFLFSRARGLPARYHRWLLQISSMLLLAAGLYMLFAAWQKLSVYL